MLNVHRKTIIITVSNVGLTDLLIQLSCTAYSCPKIALLIYYIKTKIVQFNGCNLEDFSMIENDD